MLERASGQFTIEGNVEDIFGGISGAARIARISQTCVLTGALEGESIAEYTAVLPREGDGSFQGFQRISGALGERKGTFVVCVTGEYVKGQPRGSWAIVPKSGSGDFVHIRGNGAFTNAPGKPGSYKLEFDLRKPRKARDLSPDADPTELVPGIDIVAEEEPVAVIEEPVTVIAEPTPVETAPKRRRTSKPAPNPEPIAALEPPVVEAPAAKPKRSRAKLAPAPLEEPVPVVAAETKPKRPRKKPEAIAESPVVEAPVVAEPVKPAPRSRSRKPVEPVTVEAPIPQPEPKPTRKRSRAKQPAPSPEPIPLPVAEKKPNRTRRATAA